MTTRALRVKSLSLLALGMMCTSNVQSYEIGTHARITLEAFQHSILMTDASILGHLGIPSLQYTLLGSAYYDVFALESKERFAQPYDISNSNMPGAQEKGGDARVAFRATGWLMRGAIREDDGGPLVGGLIVGNPQDDPFKSFNRFCNHFFDPLHNLALTDNHARPICVSQDTYGSAPTWASGALDAFAPPALMVIDASRRNHFSVTDAREAMWRALTGRDKSLQSALADNGRERKAYWATTFRALGDVLHLNQDMAQPQHTRNESHGTSHASDYERYIDGRAKGARSVTLGNLLNGALHVTTKPLASD